MTVGVDTYVLPENSNKYLAEVLPSSNPMRLTWEVLTDDEKAGYLSAALQRIEALNFIGNKVSFFQTLKFPRVAHGYPVNFSDVDNDIKRAQAVWAADIARQELYVKRRNNEMCVALGVVTGKEEKDEVPSEVKSILHRWLTSWRKI